jgi:hypothetical protein
MCEKELKLRLEILEFLGYPPYKAYDDYFWN